MIYGSCHSRYGLTPEGQCLPCPSHCYSCFLKPETKKFGCYYCDQPSLYSFQSNYIVGKDDLCHRYQDIAEIGPSGGCIQSYYNKYITKEYKCNRCLYKRVCHYDRLERRNICYDIPCPDDPIKNFAFILKENKCFKNTIREPESIHGCLEAQKDPDISRYLCNIQKRINSDSR